MVRQKSQLNEDHTMSYLVLACLSCFAFLWLIHHHEAAFFNVWKTIMSPFVSGIAYVATGFFGELINPLLGVTKNQAISLEVFMKTTSVSQLSWSLFSSINAFIGRYFQVILIPMGIYLFIKALRTTDKLSVCYKEFKNAEALKGYFYKNTKIAVIDKADYENLYEGQFATAQSALQFAEVHDLITMSLEKSNIEQINKEKCYQVFIEQLGPRYHSRYALFNGCYRSVILQLIHYIPEEYREEAIDYAVTGHLYCKTAIISLLWVARRFGVVPIYFFLSLKAQDRGLWYALASLGRKTVFIEGAAILAQFEHEQYCKMNKIDKASAQVAQVMSAVDGLMEALAETSLERPWQINVELSEQFKKQ